MFTGIIEAIGRVVAVAPAARTEAGGGFRLEIDGDGLFAELAPGASVAVNGACLTLTSARGAVASFDVVPETWRNTNLRLLRPGDEVNLERSLRVGDRLDGHFVQGHVDALGTVARRDRAGGEHRLWVRPPAAALPLLVRKGSVALDGVSLTIADVAGDAFSVALIPTTLERTVLGRRRPGDLVNIETDILARLVLGRLAVTREPGSPAPGGLTIEELRERGYV